MQTRQPTGLPMALWACGARCQAGQAAHQGAMAAAILAAAAESARRGPVTWRPATLMPRLQTVQITALPALAMYAALRKLAMARRRPSESSHAVPAQS